MGYAWRIGELTLETALLALLVTAFLLEVALLAVLVAAFLLEAVLLASLLPFEALLLLQTKYPGASKSIPQREEVRLVVADTITDASDTRAALP
jgi:hypothetical protein